MRVAVFLAALAAFLLPAVSAHAGHDHDHDEVADANSDVVILTSATFADFVKETDLSLIEFYAPWCGHCKALAPEYEKAATTLKEADVPVKLAKVDCTTEADVCSQFDVKGYPTLKIFRKDKPSEYKGQRKADDIISILKKQTQPVLSELKAADVAKFSASDKVVVVGYFSDQISKKFKAFQSAASTLRDDYVFGFTNDKVEGVTAPAVILYKKFDEGKSVFDGKYSEEELSTFIKTHATPLIDEIGPENYSKFVSSGLPLAYTFVENDEQRKELSAVLEPIAKANKGKINIVFIDAGKFGAHGKNLGLTETWPAFAIQEPEASLKFPYDQSKELTTAGLKAFVESYLAGEIEPTLKTEAAPEKNDAPVKVVVGSEFDKIVNDKTKDVFLEIYAPWCGHCKKLTPIWDELAELLQGDKHGKDIVIAKMDGTENDVPKGTHIKIAGFPTLKFIKAGTNDIIDYEGDRTLESLLAFVKKNAKNGSKITAELSASSDDDEDEEDGHDEL